MTPQGTHHMHRPAADGKVHSTTGKVRCPQCGHQHRIKTTKSSVHHLRRLLMLIYRDRNHHPGLSDSAEGRIFLMILLSLGLPLEDVFNHASWITFKEVAEIEKVAKRFDPTPENVGRAINFTDAERKHYGEKYHQYFIRSAESDWPKRRPSAMSATPRRTPRRGK